MGGERNCMQVFVPYLTARRVCTILICLPMISGFSMALLELKIVLSVLLPTFRFEPGSEDVVWHIGGTICGARTGLPILVLKCR
jgi:hypothetical protein